MRLGNSVLLICSDAQEDAILRAQMELAGFIVTSARDVEQANRVAKQQAPALFVVGGSADGAPETALLELRRRLGAPLLLVGSARAARTLGADAHLPANYSVADLHRRLRALKLKGNGSGLWPTRSPRAGAKDQARLLRDVFDQVGDAVLVVDARSYRILKINRQAQNIYGYSAREFGNMNLLQLLPRQQHPSLLSTRVRIPGKRRLLVPEEMHLRKDKTEVPVSLVISEVRFDGRRALQYIVHDESERIESQRALANANAELARVNRRLEQDASELARANAQLKKEVQRRVRAERIARQQALYDELTSLPNRRLLIERLKQALAFAKRNIEMIAIMFLDLDGFKGVNDTLGHDVGDQLLISVATQLASSVRQTDTVCRVGGDEFVLLVTNLSSRRDVLRVAEKVIAAVNAPHRLRNYECRISASAGIALYPRDGTEAEVLLKKADVAMYAAKKAGKNSFKFFSAQMAK